MKRTFAILLVCGLLLGLLPGCREGAPPEPSQEPSASGLPSESADSSLSAVDLASAAFDRCGREDQEGLEGCTRRRTGKSWRFTPKTPTR